MEWILELPYRTPPLSLNDRHHWSVAARKKAEVREATFWLAKAQKIPVLQRPTVVLHYSPRNRGRRDAVNLTATSKPAIDGLVDAGVLPDDTPEFVDELMPIIDTHNGVRGRLYLVIRT